MSRTRSDGAVPGWRPREIAAAAVFLAVLWLQFAVPFQRWAAALAAGEPAPARFGWQMYSRASREPVIAVVLDDGSERRVDPSSMLVQPRAEVPLEELIPALCAASPRVRAVRRTDTEPARIFACPPRERRSAPGSGGRRPPGGEAGSAPAERPPA